MVRIYLEGKIPTFEKERLPTFQELERNRRRMYNIQPSLTGKYIGLPPRDHAELPENSLAYEVIERHLPEFVEDGLILHDEYRKENPGGFKPKKTIVEEIIKEMDKEMESISLKNHAKENLEKIVYLSNARSTLATALQLGRNIIVE